MESTVQVLNIFSWPGSFVGRSKPVSPSISSSASLLLLLFIFVLMFCRMLKGSKGRKQSGYASVDSSTDSRMENQGRLFSKPVLHMA